MELAAFRQWTARLTESLQRDRRVIGLVIVGSGAEVRRAPDRWSDHDFFVLTHAGEQEAMRTDLSWLPDADQIVLRPRETDHGLKVLYADGHLIEFAIFDLHELQLARVNDYRVLFEPDDRRVSTALRGIEVRDAAPAPFDRDRELALFFSLLLVGSRRTGRGEVLSGSRFVKDFAVCALLRLLAHDQPPAPGTVPDNLDPFRRVELCYPQVATAISAALVAEPLAAAARLIDIAESNLRDVPALALAVTRRALAAASTA